MDAHLYQLGVYTIDNHLYQLVFYIIDAHLYQLGVYTIDAHLYQLGVYTINAHLYQLGVYTIDAHLSQLGVYTIDAHLYQLGVYTKRVSSSRVSRRIQKSLSANSAYCVNLYSTDNPVFFGRQKLKIAQIKKFAEISYRKKFAHTLVYVVALKMFPNYQYYIVA